ncbi:cytochrome P450 [Chondromyces apiculatus]|uniref:Cytochrome P450 n=1 Tax=Chondromyces apiculatus DSM 436 TaxID=1192034 RepID=A0A017T9Y8_9BACT|nr:cytochrome P450 [Chondromyces apiculatus]EYF06073.1 cytochrome P450 [Chondromyces apiculatus DSM 436]
MTPKRDDRQPPGPGPLSSLRYLANFRTGNMRHYEDLFARHGDVVRLRAPGAEDFVMAFHPRDIGHVLRTNSRNYPKGARYHQLVPVLGWGLVNSEGDLWRRQRRLVQPQFNHASTLAFVPLIVSHTEALLQRWDAERGEFERDINDDMLDVTFAIAGEAFFGAALEEHTDTVRSAFKYALSIALKRMYSLVNPPLSWPLPSHVRFRDAMDRVHAVIDDIIDGYQRGEGDTDNVLARLMNAVDPETGATMDRTQLRDEIKTILMVGHETSSVTATWALYLLAQHHDARAQLVEEIDRVLGGRTPTPGDIEAMPYLGMVFNECLRLLPSVPFILRSPLADDTLGGYPVAAGSTIAIVPWVTHRHPEFWTDPERFMPERFADPPPRPIDKLAFLPFGAGQRICLGEFMGQLEGKIMVAMILQRYALRLVPGFDPRCRGFISLQPLNGMRMLCRRREPVRRASAPAPVESASVPTGSASDEAGPTGSASASDEAGPTGSASASDEAAPTPPQPTGCPYSART